MPGNTYSAGCSGSLKGPLLAGIIDGEDVRRCTECTIDEIGAEKAAAPAPRNISAMLDDAIGLQKHRTNRDCIGHFGMYVEGLPFYRSTVYRRAKYVLY